MVLWDKVEAKFPEHSYEYKMAKQDTLKNIFLPQPQSSTLLFFFNK